MSTALATEPASTDTILPEIRMDYWVGSDPDVKYQVISSSEAGVQLNGSLRLHFEGIETLDKLIAALNTARERMHEEAEHVERLTEQHEVSENQDSE